MIKLSRRIITSICLLGATYASAQTTFYVDGLGRAQITNEQLAGGVLDTDTIGGVKSLERKNTGGYTLLDLGINVEKKDKFFLNAVLRGRDEFGLFWGEGTTFEFRKITMGGLIGSGIKYEMGDIQVGMSPYTVYMPEVNYNTYESEIFKTRRDIVEYENFVEGNNRFLQGLKGSGSLLFTKGIQKLNFYGFATRTSQISQLGSPDVIMGGGNVIAEQGKYGSFGVNYVSLFDLPVSTNTQTLNATTVTISLNPEIKINDNFVLGLDAEIGGSNYKSSDIAISDDETAFSGSFYDAMLRADLKKLKTTIAAGYRSVGADFRSPGAQSRRINANQSAQLFPVNMLDATGNQIVRSLMLHDRFTQENMYKQGVEYVLETFNPAFNNINPYGDATANRKGLIVDIKRGTNKDAISFDLGAKLLTEELADATSNNEFRNFLGANLGLMLNFSKILSLKKDLYLSGGYILENTIRSGNESVDLTSSVIDAALSAEVLKDVDLMVGYKFYSVLGNEYLYHYEANNFTKVTDGLQIFNSEESILSLGARYRFTENAALTANYNLTNSFNNISTVSDDYSINQLFLNYTMKF